MYKIDKDFVEDIAFRLYRTRLQEDEPKMEKSKMFSNSWIYRSTVRDIIEILHENFGIEGLPIEVVSKEKKIKS